MGSLSNNLFLTWGVFPGNMRIGSQKSDLHQTQHQTMKLSPVPVVAAAMFLKRATNGMVKSSYILVYP
jgi:hypothetical protein